MLYGAVLIEFDGPISALLDDRFNPYTPEMRIPLNLDTWSCPLHVWKREVPLYAMHNSHCIQEVLLYTKQEIFKNYKKIKYTKNLYVAIENTTTDYTQDV